MNTPTQNTSTLTGHLLAPLAFDQNGNQVHDRGHHLLITGSAGSGKSRLADSLATAELRDGADVLVCDLSGHLRHPDAPVHAHTTLTDVAANLRAVETEHAARSRHPENTYGRFTVIIDGLDSHQEPPSESGPEIERIIGVLAREGRTTGIRVIMAAQTIRPGNSARDLVHHADRLMFGPITPFQLVCMGLDPQTCPRLSLNVPVSQAIHAPIDGEPQIVDVSGISGHSPRTTAG